MKNQGTKISVIQVIMTLVVCLSLISCAKGGSQRSTEESLVLGNSPFNPGEKAPGVELDPQSSNSILEQSQNANLASFSVLSPSGISEGGYIPGSGSGSGGSDSGSIPPPGGVSNPITIPSTTIPSSGSVTTSPSEPTIPPGTSNDVSPAPTTGDVSQGDGSSTVSDGTSNSTGVYPGGNDGGIIPGSGTASGTDNGSLPNSGIPSTGDGGSAPNSGTVAVVEPGTGSSSGSSSNTDQNSGTTSGTDSSTPNSGGSTAPVADNGTLPNSGTPSDTGTDNGSLPNSGIPSTGDEGSAPNPGTVVDTGTGSASPNPGTVVDTGTGSASPNPGTVADTGTGSASPNPGTVADTGTGSASPNPGTVVDTGTGSASPNPGTVVDTGTGSASPNPGTVVDTGTGSASPNPGTSGGETQVILCHYPPGNTANSITIIIGQPAVTAHLAHGDKLGDCPSPSANNGGNNNTNPIPPVTPAPDLDDHNDTCSCHHSVHPTPCQPNKKKLTINLGRVCSIRRSKTSDLFFEEAKNPILSIEAIVPKGRIVYGSQSSNPYATRFFSSQINTLNSTPQWGVLSASNQAKERVLIATFNLKGIDLVEKKQKRSASFNLKELKKKLGLDWTKAAIVASVCDDPNNDGSCYATPKSALLSVVPATFKANRVPSQVGLDIWSGRGLSQSLDSGKCDKQYSPIVLDLTGEGIKLSAPEEGLKFDLNADGNEIYTGWIKGSNNAFLVRDINRNGKIDNGAELFGSATALKTGKRAANGFEALKDLDSNTDGLLNLKDLEWKSLRLWFDRNYDGFSQFSELNRLEQYQIQSINLNYVELLEMDEFGNQTRERSTYTRRIGGKDKPLLAVDVWFRTLIEQ